jgi:D-tyrosyl-tRNA(Tyr) deacylase
VDKAVVSVNGRVVSAIGPGLLVFLGIEKGDARDDADYLVEKLINLRIFEDGE